MKIDDILKIWSEDSKIDTLNLTLESYNIGHLHHKYFQILLQEKMLFHKYDSEYKKLYLEKHEFYIQGPSDETNKKGWIYPPIGKVLRGDIDMYMNGDKEIIEISLKISIQKEKIELLESIIKTINNRNFTLRITLDWEKFKMGN